MRLTARRWGSTFAIFLLVLANSGSVGAYPRPGHTTRVSVASNGAEGKQDALSARCWWYHQALHDITPDGRFVVFASSASNLVSDDRNKACDVFMRDRKTNKTKRISVATTGIEGIGVCTPAGLDVQSGSGAPSISADGKRVAFVSCATNLVPGDTNLIADVFVYDVTSGTIARASVGPDGAQAQGGPGSFSDSPTISGNGRSVTFVSSADGLAPREEPLLPIGGRTRVFVRDLATKTTELVSRGVDGEDPDSSSHDPSISADGRYVAYASGATNIVIPDANSRSCDVFVYDREKGETRRVNVASDGTQSETVPVMLDDGCGATGMSNEGGRTISADGRFVTFLDWGGNLVPNDTNNGGDVFVHDLKTGRTERVTVTSSGGEVREGGLGELTWGGGAPSISANGRYVGFFSALQIRGGESAPASGHTDLYVYDRLTGSPLWVTPTADGTTHGCQQTTSDPAGGVALGSGGRYAVFSTVCDEHVQEDRNEMVDTFLRDLGREFSAGEVFIGFSREGADTVGIRPVAVGNDPAGDVRGAELVGADLTGGVVASRARHRDIFVRVDVEELPYTRHIAGVHGIVYGLRFDAGGESYELRMQGPTVKGLGEPSFELYRCRRACAHIASVDGGFGTIGHAVVAAIPVRLIGLEDGGTISRVVAFTSVGRGVSGGATLDEMRLR